MGDRYFAQRTAVDLHVSGYTGNLDDGRVEVYDVGTREQVSELAGRLWKGPRMAAATKKPRYPWACQEAPNTP